MTFGEKLRQSRTAKHLTQKQLATEIGAKHNSISDWENDKNRPDPDTIELLCGVLGITPNYLLNASDDDLSLPEKNLIKKYRSLSEDSQKYVNEVIDREYKNGRLVEGQISLIPENGYVQIVKNGRWQNYMKASDFFASLNAAHNIADSSNEDQKHDDDIMNGNDF